MAWPRVDRGNGRGRGLSIPAIAADLYGYWPLADASSTHRWAEQSVPPFVDVGGVPRATGATYGAEADFNNDDSKYLRHAIQPSGFRFGGGATDWTLALVINRRTGSGQQAVVSSGTFLLWEQGSLTSFAYCGGVLRFGPAGAQPAVDTPTPLVIRYNATTRVMRMKVGAGAETSATMPAAIDADGAYVYLGQDFGLGAGAKKLLARLSHLAFWRRELNDAERDQYLANPRYPFAATLADRIGISLPRAWSVRQRSGGTAAIPVAGYYYGPTTPTAIEYRLDSGSWQTLDAAPANGVYAGTVSGVAARAARYSLSVRFSNSTGVSSTVNYVGVGDVFLLAGQSNCEGHVAAAQSYTRSGDLSASMVRSDNGWLELADPTSSPNHDQPGSYWPHMVTDLLPLRDVPIAILNRGDGGTSITAWLPGQPLYETAVADAQTVGGVAAVLWHQGESDALAGMAQATYEGHLTTLAAGVTTDLACPLLAARLQNSSGIGDAAENAIRAAVDAKVADLTIKAGPDLSDLATDDAYHLTNNSSAQTAGERWAVAVDAAI